MKRLLKATASSFVLATVLFTVIRISHDLTVGEDYWGGHSRTFILTELLLTWCFSLATVLLAPLLIRFGRLRKLSAAVEYLLVVFFASGCFLCAIFISHSIDTDGMPFTKIILPLTVTDLCSCLYYSYSRASERDRRLTEQTITLERTRREQLDTELRLLRAQYHPHFLFNMLNTVYVQIDEDNDAPRHTIECLSEVLRYQLYSPDNPVDVASELEVLEKFIELCRLRTSRSLRFSADILVPPPEAQLRIYPLLLIPLVENAFKYVGGDYIIRISFRHTGSGMLCLSVSNSLPSNRREPAPDSSGLGLDNLRRRLSLLYPSGSHSLDVSADDDTFTATLCLKPIRTNF